MECLVCNDEFKKNMISKNIIHGICVNGCYEEYLEDNRNLCNSKFYMRIKDKEFQVIAMINSNYWCEKLEEFAMARDMLIESMHN